MFRSSKTVATGRHFWPKLDLGAHLFSISLVAAFFVVEPVYSQDLNDPSIVILASETPPSLRRPQADTSARPKEEQPKRASPVKPAAKQTKSAANAKFNEFNNYDIPGFDISGGAAASDQGPHGCEETCRTVRGCVAYTYDTWNKRCSLKTGADTRRFDVRATSGVMADLPTPRKSKAPIVYEYFNNSEFWGMGLGGETPSRSREQCEAKCDASSECVAYTFNGNADTCMIFHDPIGRQPLKGVQSAGKVQR